MIIVYHQEGADWLEVSLLGVIPTALHTMKASDAHCALSFSSSKCNICSYSSSAHSGSALQATALMIYCPLVVINNERHIGIEQTASPPLWSMTQAPTTTRNHPIAPTSCSEEDAHIWPFGSLWRGMYTNVAVHLSRIHYFNGNFKPLSSTVTSKAWSEPKKEK